MVTHTFTINNTGTGALTLPMPVSVAPATHFSVTTQPVSPVIAGGNTTFAITFDPTASGTHTATVSVPSSDSDEDPYTFDIQGGGLPAIEAGGNGNPIDNRSYTTSPANGTDFGNVNASGGTVSNTFSLGNSSNSTPLTLTGTPLVTVAGQNAADFTVTIPPVSPIAPGGNTPFTIEFNPGAPGYRWAIVIITHTDFPENPFVFMVSGIGL